jgi:cyanate permease
MPTAQQMYMEVIDGLSAVWPGIDDQAIAIRQILLPGYRRGGGEQVTQCPGVFSVRMCAWE